MNPGEQIGPGVAAQLVSALQRVGNVIVIDYAAYAHGTRSASETKHLGMVGLEVQIVEPTTGRLLDSFTAEGSFTAIGTTTVRTTWGKTKTKADYASSAIGQAQRMALNQTITRIHAALTRQTLLAGRR